MLINDADIVLTFSECPKHCSMCYNETECYECTQGYFLDQIQECESKFYMQDDYKLQQHPNMQWIWEILVQIVKNIKVNYIFQTLTIINFDSIYKMCVV